MSKENGNTSVADRLLKNRIIVIGDEINAKLANDVVAKLLLLNADSEQPIRLFINSPGGEVTSGLAIYDTMRFISAPVATYCMGMAASMGALLLAAGDGRYALPNARIMIHQPLGGAQGTATQIAVEAKEIIYLRQRINEILSGCTKQSVEKIAADTDRDFWLSAKEAQEYGLVDHVLCSETLHQKYSGNRIQTFKELAE